MGDIWLKAAYGAQNEYIKDFLKKKPRKDCYASKEERIKEKEYELLEDDLEKELEMSRIQMECEVNDFEKSLNKKDKLDYNEFLNENSFADTVNQLLWHENKYMDYTTKFDLNKVTEEKDNMIQKYESKITLNMDIINNIFLEIELDESFTDLTSEEKYAILDSDVELVIGGSTIDKSKILSCLFIQLCSGQKINEKENRIQIPIYDFNSLWFTSKNGEKEKYGNLKGLPLISMIFSQLKINLFVPKILNKFKMNLVLHGKIIDAIDRSNLVRGQDLQFIIFQNKILEHKEKYYNNIKLNFNNLSKFMLIYFKPKVFTNTNFWDLSLEYPELEYAKLVFHGLSIFSLDFSDKDDEILSFEFFGIKIYLLPYSNDIDTWEKIKESFENIYENFNHNFINFSRLDHVKLNLDISGNKENFDIIINNINFNIIQIIGGMCGLKFCR